MPALRTVLAAVAIGVVIASSACTEEEAIFAVPASSSGASGPSQSTADAQRDGVSAAVHSLSFEERVYLIPGSAAATLGHPVTIGDDTWIITEPRVRQIDYGEVVQVDQLHRRIVKAYPLPGVPPQRLVSTNDAVFCGRGGDGGLPTSMVCRIDRRTREMIVHVFWRSRAPYPAPILPGWTISGEELEMYALEADETGLWAKDYFGKWTRLDPVTLRVTERNVIRGEVSPPEREIRPLT